MLHKVFESDPNTRWWIKGDGVDVVKGLCESVKGQWSGDVDLNDGQLDVLYQEYQLWLNTAKQIGLRERKSNCLIHVDLSAVLQQLVEELEFLHSGRLLILYLYNYSKCIIVSYRASEVPKSI